MQRWWNNGIITTIYSTYIRALPIWEPCQDLAQRNSNIHFQPTNLQFYPRVSYTITFWFISFLSLPIPAVSYFSNCLSAYYRYYGRKFKGGSRQDLAKGGKEVYKVSFKSSQLQPHLSFVTASISLPKVLFRYYNYSTPRATNICSYIYFLLIPTHH